MRRLCEAKDFLFYLDKITKINFFLKRSIFLFLKLQIGPISSSASNEQILVVPKVAQTFLFNKNYYFNSKN